METRRRHRKFSWVLAAGVLAVGCAAAPRPVLTRATARPAVQTAPMCCTWSTDGARLECEAVGMRAVGRTCAPVGTSALQSAFDIGEGAH